MGCHNQLECEQGAFKFFVVSKFISFEGCVNIFYEMKKFRKMSGRKIQFIAE